MLALVGERTSMIYLGSFVMTAALTLIMAHTAVAAALYPLLIAIYALYDEDNKPTKFGKGLFMGMAFVAGAGSIITLLGAARGAIAIGFFKDIIGREVSFFELTYYMAPIGVVMVILLWGFFMVFFKPEQKTIPGLRERVHDLNANLGGITKTEIITLIIVFACISTMALRSFVPALASVNKSAILLVATILFFVLRILTIEDLEKIPWNIVLLFGGAMSIGFCLWQTGAASWLAIKWLGILEDASWFVFIMGVSFFVLIMTNFIMNVAAIAISLPVALVIAPYLGVAPEVVLFSALTVAGMPFLLLVGAAPNAIAYESKQFTSGEFFRYGIPASILLMVVLAFFVGFIWPMMGMPITATPLTEKQEQAHILLIDHDEELIHVLSSALDDKGCQASTMFNCINALEFLHNNKPDLVLLNLSMPHQCGRNLFFKINLEYPDLKMILLSDSHSPISHDICQGRVYRKPVDVDSLLVTINRILGESK